MNRLHFDRSAAPGALSRRGFLGSSLALAVAPSWPSRADEPLPSLTLVNLMGGNDALNTVIPTGLANYVRARPTLAIAPELGASLDGGPAATRAYVLHPALSNLARRYREGQVALIRCVGYPEPDQSHFNARDVWSRGYRRAPAPHSGWIARFKDRYARPPISVVALGLAGQSDFLGGETDSTFLLDDQTQLAAGFRFTGDLDYPANNRYRYQLAEQIAQRTRQHPLEERARNAMKRSLEDQRLLSGGGTSLVGYPRSIIGNAMQTLGALFNLDLPIRVAYVNFGNFDTHANQGSTDGDHAAQLRDLDLALEAYANDMQAQGLWQHKAIALFSEFGRRNAQNGNGTDHGEGGVMIVFGGRVRGGLYGPDLTDDMLRSFVLPCSVDFRSVYAAILEQHFAVDAAPVFAESYQRTPLGLFLA